VAVLNDNANIFTGSVLAAFNQMQTYVARDADLVGAQDAMLKAMTEVNHVRTVERSGTSSTQTKRTI
jgi:hypothetical protein